MPNITQRLVDSLRPKRTRYTISDRGLVVEVNPSGKIVFFASFRQGGARHKQKLGDSAVITVGDARGELLDIQHRIQIRNQSAARSRVTFKEFALEEGRDDNYRFVCESNHKNPQATLNRIRKQFVADNNRIGRARLVDITPAMIEAYKAGAWRRHAAKTVLRNLYTLRAVLSLAHERELIRSNPADKVKNPKVDTGASPRLMLDEAEYSRLIRALDVWRDRGHIFSDHPHRDHFPQYLPAIVYMALHLGLRKSEILQLRFADWGIERKEVTVRAETTKNSKTRILPMTPVLEDAVREWMSIRVRDFGALIFSGELDGYGEPDFKVVLQDHSEELIFPIADPKRSWLSLRKMASLEHIVFHTLRHHFASTLVQNGAALTVVRDLMGHKDIRTTNIYLSTTDTIKREALEGLSEHLQEQVNAARLRSVDHHN